MRAESNSDAKEEGNAEAEVTGNVEENETVDVEESSEEQAEVPSEEAKPPRKPRVKLGDIMGVIQIEMFYYFCVLCSFGFLNAGKGKQLSLQSSIVLKNCLFNRVLCNCIFPARGLVNFLTLLSF